MQTNTNKCYIPTYDHSLILQQLTMTLSAFHVPETVISERHYRDPEMSENNNNSIHITKRHNYHPVKAYKIAELIRIIDRKQRNVHKNNYKIILHSEGRDRFSNFSLTEICCIRCTM